MSSSNASERHQALVDYLKQRRQITSSLVEAAFRTVERQHFLPDTEPELVYSDSVVVTKQDAAGHAISSSSQPAIMALMLEQLRLKPGMNVLEIGAGTGYNAALMAHIVGEKGRVTAIDIDEDTVANARAHLASADVDNVQVICADGVAGYQENAPYDRVILSVSSWDVAPAWIAQLKPGGRLVMPLMLKNWQVSAGFVLQRGQLQSYSITPCAFMPLRGSFEAPHSIASHLVEEGLQVVTQTQAQLDVGVIPALLTQPHQCHPTGLSITPSTDFHNWLTLHDAQALFLKAEGERADGSIPFIGGVQGQFSGTHGVLIGKNLALLSQPEGTPLPETKVNPKPFDLFICNYGQQVVAAQRLMTHLKRWDAVGRPSIVKSKMRVYPLDAPYKARSNELVLPKKWHKLVIRWGR